MSRVSKLLLFTSICLYANTTFAKSKLDYDIVSEISIFPVYLTNATFPPVTDENQENYYFFGHSRWSVSSENFSFEVQPEIRSVQSSAALTTGMREAVRSPNRLMSLNTKVASKEREESVLDVERLNVTYIWKGAQLSLGRKPVSLGVLSVFPVWNKFSRPLMTDFGPLRVFSQDQVAIKKQQGPWLFQAIDMEMREHEFSTRIAEVTWFGEGIEFHVISGDWQQSGAFGIAAVKDIAGTSIKFEEISFSSDGVQAGLGAERALDEYWSLLGELLYLETGASHKENYLTLAPSSFRPLNARYYGYLRAEYKPWPLWIFQLGDLINFVDSSQLFNAKAFYSAANDFELSLELRLPTGGYDTELSRHFMATQALLGGRYDF